MADNDVKLKFFANAAAAEKAIVGLEKKFDDLQNKIKQVSKRSKETATESQSAFSSLENSMIKSTGAMGGALSRLAGLANPVTIAFSAIAATVAAATQKNLEFSRSVGESAKKFNEAELKLKIQGGFDNKGMANQNAVIRQALKETPSSDIRGAYDISTQLASSGFKDADIKSGAALKAVLDINAATTQFGGEVASPKESTLAISQFLKATGNNAPEAKDIRRLGGQLAQLFNKSDFQFSHLKELAGDSATLTQFGIDPREQLAAFGATVDVKNPSEAATGMRLVATDLATAKGVKEKRAALARIGLRPEQVDLNGEGLMESVGVLDQALNKQDKTTQNLVTHALFGDRGQTTFAVLRSRQQKIAEFRGALEGDAFENGIADFQKSRFARGQRVQNEREFEERAFDNEQGGMSWEEYRNASRLQATKMRRGRNIFQRFGSAIAQGIGEAGMFAGEMAGATPNDFGATPQAMGAKDLAIGILQAIEANTRGKVNRNAQGE